jgi:hypothetical protein
MTVSKAGMEEKTLSVKILCYNRHMRLMKIISLALIVSLVFGCGATQLTYQEMPKDKPLAVKINGIAVRVVSFGFTDDWSELELAIANDSDFEINFDATQVYLTNEQGYDLIPLRGGEINERVHRKTGQWITPLTVGALAAGIAAIIAPSSKDRTNLARGALALGGAAVGAELGKRQSAEADVQRKEDFLLKSYKILPKLQLGGVLYYRSTKAAKGVKVFIKTKSGEEFFHIEF